MAKENIKRGHIYILYTLSRFMEFWGNNNKELFFVASPFSVALQTTFCEAKLFCFLFFGCKSFKIRKNSIIRRRLFFVCMFCFCNCEGVSLKFSCLYIITKKIVCFVAFSFFVCRFLVLTFFVSIDVL